MIRNDADIVEAFVRHSVRLLDHLFVMVHSPEDGTEEILKALLGEGLPLTLVFDDEPAFLQGERLTWLARQAHAALPCDFLFALDADEFIVPAQREAIDAALATLPAEAPAARVRLRTFVPTADDPPDEPNPIRRIRYRVNDEPKVGKVVLTRSFVADPTLVVDHGNHALLRIGSSARPIRVPPLRDLALAHYPVRSAAQITSKTIIGYLAHLACTRPAEEEQRLATHWRRAYEEMVLKGATRGMDERQLVAWFHGRQSLDAGPGEFVLDPTPAPFELRYGHLVRNDAYAALARFAEHLIRKRPAPLEGARFDHLGADAPQDEDAMAAGRRG